MDLWHAWQGHIGEAGGGVPGDFPSKPETVSLMRIYLKAVPKGAFVLRRIFGFTSGQSRCGVEHFWRLSAESQVHFYVGREAILIDDRSDPRLEPRKIRPLKNFTKRYLDHYYE
jgi:hypothetical protein